MSDDFFKMLEDMYKESYDSVYNNIVSVEFPELNDEYKHKITGIILLAIYTKHK